MGFCWCWPFSFVGCNCAWGSVSRSRSALPRARESPATLSPFRTAVRFNSLFPCVVSPAGAPAPLGDTARGPPPLSLGRNSRTVRAPSTSTIDVLGALFAAIALIGVRQCYAQAPTFLSATGLLKHVPTRCPAPSSRGSPARTADGSHYPPPTAASMRAGGSPPLAPKVRGILP